MENTTKTELLRNQIAEFVGTEPVLLSDLAAHLRDRGWRLPGPRVYQEDIILGLGFHFGKREHAAGSAVYVFTTAFTTATDFNGKPHAIQSYYRDERGLYHNDPVYGCKEAK